MRQLIPQRHSSESRLTRFSPESPDLLHESSQAANDRATTPVNRQSPEAAAAHRTQRNSEEGRDRAADLARADVLLKDAQPPPEPEYAADNPLLTRKLLIYSPFTLYTSSDKQNQRTMVYDRVPNLFQILKERDGWLWLGDRRGYPLGWKERRSVEDVEWQSRLVWRPETDRLPVSPALYRSLESAVACTEPIRSVDVRLKSGFMFPVLSIETRGGNSYAFLARPPSVKASQMHDLPAWIPLDDTRGRPHGTLGVAASINELEKYRSGLNMAVTDLELQGPERNDLGTILFGHRVHACLLITGQDYKTFKRKSDAELQRGLGSLLPRGLVNVTATQASIVNDRGYGTFVKQAKSRQAKIQQLVNDMQQPDIASKIPSDALGGAAYTPERLYFVPLDYLP